MATGQEALGTASETEPRAGSPGCIHLVGYVWADEPRSTACAVVTGTAPATEKKLLSIWRSSTGTPVASFSSAL